MRGKYVIDIFVVLCLVYRKMLFLLIVIYVEVLIFVVVIHLLSVVTPVGNSHPHVLVLEHRNVFVINGRRGLVVLKRIRHNKINPENGVAHFDLISQAKQHRLLRSHLGLPGPTLMSESDPRRAAGHVCSTGTGPHKTSKAPCAETTGVRMQT